MFSKSVIRANSVRTCSYLINFRALSGEAAKKKKKHFLSKSERRKLFVDPKPIENKAIPRVKMASSAKSGAITLTGNENSLFAMLRVVVTDMGLGTTVRVAGGWVRDKLLYGASKDDVDICLDNMTGEQFCYHMNEWSRSRGQQVHKFGVIQSNPAKSKHLATATLKLNGLEVDFVNLRSETYVENSRIPLVEFGTPLDDALRRDLTVNSLFYNIHTDEIEDFTGRGLEDMKNRILRTPLEPLVTLIDDPLRAFRVLRFACRLNFRIVPPLLDACGSPEVAASLAAKVSRERILKEAEGTLTGSSLQASRAVYLLHRLGLLRCMLYACRPEDSYPSVVLADGTSQPMTEAAFSTARERGASLMMLSECIGHYLAAPIRVEPWSRCDHLAAVHSAVTCDREGLVKDVLTRRFATLTHPFDAFTIINPLKPTRQISLSEHILANEVKVPSKVANVCGVMQKGIRSFKKILQEHWGLGGTSSVSSISTRPDRGTLGAVVKECGPIYREAIFIAVTDLILDILLSGDSLSMDANIDILISAIARQLEIVEVVDMNKMEITKSTASSLDSLPLLTLLSSEPCQRVFNSAEELIALIGTMMLHEVWLQPPLVDGKALKEILPNCPPGPIFSEILNSEFIFRMNNPDADARMAAAHLQNLYGDRV